MPQRNNEDTERDWGGNINDASSAVNRRQALGSLASLGASGLFIPGVSAERTGDGRGWSGRGHGSDGELSDNWWHDDNVSESDIEVVAQGASEFTTEDDQVPDWLAIGEENEAKVKPHGAYRIHTDTRAHDESSGAIEAQQYDGPSGSNPLCLPTSVELSNGTTVGLKACHYGGCEWSFEACLVVCAGTGMNESCNGGFSFSASLGSAVTLDTWFDPRGEPAAPYSTVIVLQEVHMNGELCHWTPSGSDCHSVDLTFDFAEAAD